MQINVFVGLKNGVLDTQGNTVADALRAQGFTEINQVKIGKWITLDIDAASADEAQEKAKAMCEALLVNQVIETYHLALEQAPNNTKTVA